MSRGCSTILKSMTSKGLKRTFTFLARWANLAIDMLMAVARVLNRLPQPVVYTGGATISLYLDALSARDMRPTDDSKDFEDIITLFNGCPNLVAEIAASEVEVKTFITAWVRTERQNLDAMAPAFLSNADRLAGRDRLLLETIAKVEAII